MIEAIIGLHRMVWTINRTTYTALLGILLVLNSARQWGWAYLLGDLLSVVALHSVLMVWEIVGTLRKN